LDEFDYFAWLAPMAQRLNLSSSPDVVYPARPELAPVRAAELPPTTARRLRARRRPSR
jgi:hypothetical protein